MNLVDIGKKLKKTREKSGMKQREVARKLGINNSLLCRYEKGEYEPSYETLVRLADLYGVSSDFLLGRNNNGSLLQMRESSPDYMIPVGPTVKIPVLGVIRAGEPIFADQNIIGYEDVPATEVKDGDYFYLVVAGDSMIGSRIQQGDKVLIRKQEYVDNGQIAVVLVNDEEATLKRVKYIDDSIILYPDNPKYQPKIYKVEDVRILGKVVKVEFKPS